jgi:anti-anti-sigma regulatory factor
MSQTAPSTGEGERSHPLSSIELQGAFDARAARDVLELLQRQASVGQVLLDFGKVSTFQDFALDLLVQGVSRMPELHVRTRGIPGHPARVLQYLNIDPHTLAPAHRGMRCPACFPPRDDRDLDD